MELVINFSGGKDSSAMLLSAPCVLPVRVTYVRPVATHQVVFYWMRKYSECEREVLGNITLRMDDPSEARRLARVKVKIAYLLGNEVSYSCSMLAMAKEASRLSDLERMRRKWRKVIAAFESDRADILSGKEGIFIEEGLRQLDAVLEKVQAKVEHTYGRRIEELDDKELKQRTEELRQLGLIDTKDHTHLH